MRCLSTFSGCGWAHGITFTSLPPQTLPQICESWLKVYLMQVSKPCHYALVEAVDLFKLHPTSMWYLYERFEHLLRLWMGMWLLTHTVTTTDASPDLARWLKSYLMHVCIPCHYDLIEAVEPSKLHPTSMLYIYEVLRCLSDFSGYGWAYDLPLTSILIQMLPQICESWLKLYLMQMWKPCCYALIEAVDPFKLHPISISIIYKVLIECLLRLWIGIWLTFTSLPPQTLTKIFESWVKSYLMQVCKPCHYALVKAIV